MKIIRIDDENYSKLKYLAGKECRSMANYLTIVLNNALGGGSISPQIPTKIEVPIQNNSVSNSENVDEFLDKYTTKGSDFVPKPPDPKFGYPCCQSKSYVCKHWIFDDLEGHWTNTLTAEIRSE